MFVEYFLISGDHNPAPRILVLLLEKTAFDFFTYLCKVERQLGGALKQRAEIIPTEPDAGNAAEGRQC